MARHDSEPLATSPGRLHSLDGLRGVAALVVVLYHTATTWTPYALEARRQITTGEPGSALWWLTATPLSLAVAGGEAVLVFFVLSGVAVILPVLRRPNFDWWAFYPRRAIRLLVPAMASVVLAAIWGYATIGHRGPQSNPVLQTNIPPTVDWRSFVRALDLSSGETTVNSPLWSLNWEVWFSMALPIFAIAALLVRKRLALAVAIASIVLSFIGYQVNALAFAYQAPFVLGALIAGNMPALTAILAKWNRSLVSEFVWPLVVVVALSFIGLGEWTYAWTNTTITWSRYTGGLVCVGAALLVVCVIYYPRLRAVFEMRPIQWLGKISFSLYLVHLPILSASGAFLGTEHWIRAAAVGIPAAFIVAIFFHRFVEMPSHRLSKRVGVFISGRIRQAEAHNASGSDRLKSREDEAQIAVLPAIAEERVLRGYRGP